MGFIEATRTLARPIKRDVLTVWFCRLHPATPWYAKVIGGLVVAYALSPIDLIPDFIPVLGYLDDVLLLPFLTWRTYAQGVWSETAWPRSALQTPRFGYHGPPTCGGEPQG
jgi:uncharacterized membrane protein YkvA (DUF1232 family)